jgi:hypothetical protein
MPTIKPRIAVTLPPHVGETYKRLAKLQGRSAAAVAADLLLAAHEPMCRTLAVLEAARDAPRHVLDGIREAAEETERTLTQAYAGGLDQLDWIMERVRQPELPEAPTASPRLVTRGSGRQKRDADHKKPPISRARKTRSGKGV